MKVGMVGLDTSHCVAFTRILNDESYQYHIPGARVIGAYPGGSELFSLSRDRVAGFTADLRDTYGVSLYERIEDLVEDVEAIFLESVDGRQHWPQFQQMAAGKPVFIDKPFAVSTVDARAIIELAQETGTPIMSASSLRYARGIADLVSQDETVISGEAFGPAAILADYPGLFWYGIHSAEVLVAFMGMGCERVRCLPYQDMDVIIGEWGDGRLGVVRGTRFEKNEFGCVIHTTAGARAGVALGTPPNYFLLLQQVMQFFETGISPIDLGETFAITSFLEAANASRKQDGRAVQVQSL
jgi:hypothetical protein